MNHSEKIITLAQSATNKIKIKGSQFIGYAFDIKNLDEANSELTKLKKKYYDATHHCYCFSLKDGNEKYSDDGEPNGSAGIRIKNAIDHFNLTDILVVVVRYFGGTKLGIGPLGKAYSEAAQTLLESTNKIELTKYMNVSVEFDYDSTSKIHFLINKFNSRKITNHFAEKPMLKFFIEPYQFSKLAKEINDQTSGKAHLNNHNSEIYLIS